MRTAIMFIIDKLIMLLQNGCTALQRAAADGHSEAVEILLQHGADPNRQDTLVSLQKLLFEKISLFYP